MHENKSPGNRQQIPQNTSWSFSFCTFYPGYSGKDGEAFNTSVKEIIGSIIEQKIQRTTERPCDRGCSAAADIAARRTVAKYREELGIAPQTWRQY